MHLWLQNADCRWFSTPNYFGPVSPASSTFSTSSTSSASPASWGAWKYLFGKGLWCNYRIRITVYDGHQGMCWLITNVLPLMNHSLVNRSHQIFVIHFTPRRKILNPGKTRFIESLNITGSFSPLWNFSGVFVLNARDAISSEKSHKNMFLTA